MNAASLHQARGCETFLRPPVTGKEISWPNRKRMRLELLRAKKKRPKTVDIVMKLKSRQPYRQGEDCVSQPQEVFCGGVGRQKAGGCFCRVIRPHG